jgi:hypothetical protein
MAVRQLDDQKLNDFPGELASKLTRTVTRYVDCEPTIRGVERPDPPLNGRPVAAHASGASWVQVIVQRRFAVQQRAFLCTGKR